MRGVMGNKSTIQSTGRQNVGPMYEAIIHAIKQGLYYLEHVLSYLNMQL